MHIAYMMPPPEITFEKDAYGSDFGKSQLPKKVFIESEKRVRKYLEVFKKLVYPNFIIS